MGTRRIQVPVLILYILFSVIKVIIVGMHSYKSAEILKSLYW